MHPIAIAGGLVLLVFVLWDAFETIVLPRRVSRRFRLTTIFYRGTWPAWRALAARRKAGNERENFISIYGPLSLLLLLAAWALALIGAFGLLHWGFGTGLQMPEGISGFPADLYFSGTTFFTLGLGELFPRSIAARVFTVIEGGTGFAFLALVIGYLPVLSQASSRREANITLLDARAGSPPTALELLRRNFGDDGAGSLSELLVEWERWSADLLETHVSFPVLGYYRSQHDNQSWVAALTTMLDVSAIIMAGLEGGPVRVARLTFAMARHAVVDMTNVFQRPPSPPRPDRLPPEELARLRRALEAAGLRLPDGRAVDDKLCHLRRMYEPYVNALGEFLLMPIPRWLPPENAKDNWQTMV